MKVYDDIKAGLEQAIAYEKGEIAARVTKRTAKPNHSATPDNVTIQTSVNQDAHQQAKRS